MRKKLCSGMVLGVLLGATVGQVQAAPACGDLDDSGSIVASDALLLLRFAVGQDVSVTCPSATGSFCWDTSGDGICDPAEDLDGDGFCDAVDCRGADGAPGPTGPQGPAGPQGVTGEAGLPGEKGDPGAAGPKGADGPQGEPGEAGPAGPTGPTGPAGPVGPPGLQGNPGLNGKDGAPGHDGIAGPPGEQGPPGLQGEPGRDGAPGRDGERGPQGPPGWSGGWTRTFQTAAISSAKTDVLVRRVTGTTGYMVNAKVGAPFANGAKQVTCNLNAIEDGTETLLDTSETLWLGSSNATAKGVIALNGVYQPTGGASAGVDLVLQCFTGGDTRTLTRGVMNIVGVNTID